MFEKITPHVWDAFVRELGSGSPLLLSPWEEMLSDALPFVTFQHYRYGEDYAIRFACIGNRYAPTPFSEGGDVVAITDAPLDAGRFAEDISKTFPDARLRISERLCPLQNAPAEAQAHEHVVMLRGELLPRVRKTLRHILEKEDGGQIERTGEAEDIERVYALYLSHMRQAANFAMPRELFTALIHALGAELWVFRTDGRVEAMAVFVRQGDEALYALSAASRAGFAVHAPHHLLYQALMHYQKEGAARASLGTTGTDSSLETFKRGWRGDEYRVFEIGGAAHEGARTSRLRALVRLVPLPLYPLLTTTLGKRFF